MTTDSQQAADAARNERDKVSGIGKHTLRYKDDDHPTMKGLAAKSRAGTLDTQEDETS